MNALCKPLETAPPRRPAFGLRRPLDLVSAMLRTLRNRRQIRTLDEFSDEQLADIGLTRNDLRTAMNEGRLSDPSGYLTQTANDRRHPIRRAS